MVEWWHGKARKREQEESEDVCVRRQLCLAVWGCVWTHRGTHNKKTGLRLKTDQSHGVRQNRQRLGCA